MSLNAAHDAGVEIDAGFAPDHEGATWTYSGSLTFANAGSVHAAAAALRLPEEGEVDLDNLVELDSSAVAVLVALLRRAAEEGKPLRFLHAPPALAALAEVYGVEAILRA
jgi:phospholipid transport system transporter-binding protein